MRSTTPRSEKTLGTATLIMLAIVVFFRASLSFPDLIFYLQTGLLILYGFLCFVFVMTIFKGRRSTSLPFITFNAMLLNTILFHRYMDEFYLIALFGITIFGLVISSIKMYVKNKELPRIYKRSDAIDKELDDDWTEDPHVIYEQ